MTDDNSFASLGWGRTQEREGWKDYRVSVKNFWGMDTFLF